MGTIAKPAPPRFKNEDRFTLGLADKASSNCLNNPSGDAQSISAPSTEMYALVSESKVKRKVKYFWNISFVVICYCVKTGSLNCRYVAARWYITWLILDYVLGIHVTNGDFGRGEIKSHTVME